MLLENGREIYNKSIRHINIIYYFLTDRIKRGYFKVDFLFK